MSQVLFGTDTTPSLGDLDANFTEVYDLRNYVRTPAYAAATYAFTIDASLRTIFGHTTSIAAGSQTPIVQNHGTSLNASSYGQYIYAASSTGSRIFFNKSRNASIGSHTIVQSGDTLGRIDFQGSDGTDFQPAAAISVAVDGTPGTGDMPGRMVVSVTPDGSATLAEVWRWSNDMAALGRGSIKSDSSSGGIGYATGAGGTVTQATSKSTGVTINTICGQITMNAASLAASTTVGFTVTNSTVATSDVVILCIDSGATTNSYTAQVGAIGAGTFRIELRNTSGGALAEAVVLNFAVIKGVTS